MPESTEDGSARGSEAMTAGAESAGFGPSADLPPLPPLPQYTCGACGETHGSNCDPDDIVCPYCEARRCPHCLKWFGAEFGEDTVVTEQADSDHIPVSPQDLRRLTLLALPVTREDDEFVQRMTALWEGGQ